MCGSLDTANLSWQDTVDLVRLTTNEPLSSLQRKRPLFDAQEDEGNGRMERNPDHPRRHFMSAYIVKVGLPRNIHKRIHNSSM